MQKCCLVLCYLSAVWLAFVLTPQVSHVNQMQRVYDNSQDLRRWDLTTPLWSHWRWSGLLNDCK